MAYDYISRGKAKENGYTNTRVFKMFGVSSTGYYNYVSRREDRDGKQAAKEMDESHVIQCGTTSRKSTSQTEISLLIQLLFT